MKFRPTLIPGDIVKLSKNGKKYPREFLPNASLIVSSITGDSTERSSIITCRTLVNDEYKFYKFYRSELWFTGKNAFVNKV